MRTDIIYKQHIREMEEILWRAHNNKRQYFIEPFLKSVCCKRDHVWRSFLSCPLVLSRLTTAHIYRLFFFLAMMSQIDQIWQQMLQKIIFQINSVLLIFLFK